VSSDLQKFFTEKEMSKNQMPMKGHPTLEQVMRLSPSSDRMEEQTTDSEPRKGSQSKISWMKQPSEQQHQNRLLQPSSNIRLALQYREEVSEALSPESKKDVDRAPAIAYNRMPGKVIFSKQAQPRWGSTIKPEKIITNVEKGSAWATSFFSDVAAEKGAEKEVAANLCMQVVQFLEEHKVRLTVRELAPRDDELRELVRPRRPGTLSRHCRMFGRFASFLMGDGFARSVTPLIIDGPLVLSWLTDLMNHNVGANTPAAAMGCLRFFSELLGFDFSGNFKIINNKILEYKENRSLAPQQAAPFGVDVLRWLEEMVMDTSQADVDRAVCGRWRLMVQASVRHDDLRRTPIGKCKWVVNKEGELRGLWAQAAETKTFPRSWVCAVGSVDCHDEWLPTFMKLMREAHGLGFNTDDHFGKRTLPDRSGYDIGPTDGQADTYHVRYLLLQENIKRQSSNIPERFRFEDIRKVRHHGAKCTFTSCAQYLQHKGYCKVSRAAVRNQGGWKAKGEDSMPDTYLRSKQLLFLELQEKCLAYIRKFGALDYESDWVPVSQSDMPVPVVGKSQGSDWLSADALIDSLDALLPLPLKTPSPGFPTPPELESPSAPSSPPQEGASSAGIEGSQEEEFSVVASPSSSEEEQFSDHISEVDSSDEDTPVFVPAILCQFKTFTYHLPDPAGGEGSACRRAKQNLELKEPEDFAPWRASFLTSACGVCFPIPNKLIEPCTHICGQVINGEICTNRCRETCNSGHDLHDCFEHCSDRASKRAKTDCTVLADLGPSPSLLEG